MRREVESRPALLAAASLAIGLSASYGWWHPLAALLLVLILRSPSAKWIWIAGLALGILLRPPVPEPFLGPREPFLGPVAIASVPLRMGSSLVAEARWQGRPYRIVLPESADVSLGDWIEAGGIRRPWREHQPPAIEGTLEVIGSMSVLRHGPSVWRLGLGARRSFEAFLERFGDPRAAALLDALCFSGTTDLDSETRLEFQRSGAAHVLSVSGLHVLVVGAALAWAFSRLPVPRWAQLALLFALLLLYAGASGLRPPVVRAVLMSGVFMAAYLFRREPDGLSTVSVAAVASMLISPSSIVDVGFLLSFAAVYGMALYLPAWEEGHDRLVYSARLLFASTVVATIFTAPLVAYFFGEVPWVGLASNFLLAFSLPFAIVGALAAWVMSSAWVAAGVGVLKSVSEPFAGWILAVVDLIGGWEHATIPVPSFHWYWLPFLYLLAFLAWRPKLREP